MESPEFELEDDILITYPLLTPPVNLDERRSLLDTWCKEATQSQLGGWLADIAFGCEELGLLYEHASRYEEALELFSQALAIREPIYGTPHLLLCNGHLNVSRILTMIGDTNKADEVLKLASDMRHQIFGPKGELEWQRMPKPPSVYIFCLVPMQFRHPAKPQYNIVQDGESYVKLGLCLDTGGSERRQNRAGRLLHSAPASTPSANHPSALAPSPLTYSQADDIKCKKCGSGESPALLVLCDICNRGFHIWCLPSPLDCVPSDPTWVCYKCERRKRKREKKEKRRVKKAKLQGTAEPALADLSVRRSVATEEAGKKVLECETGFEEGGGSIKEGENSVGDLNARIQCAAGMELGREVDGPALEENIEEEKGDDEKGIELEGSVVVESVGGTTETGGGRTI